MSDGTWTTVSDNKSPFNRFIIRKKVIDTNNPYIKKLILFIRMNNHNAKAMFLVRDGFIVKPVRKQDKRYLFLAYRAGYKMSLRSKNLGALFEKYDIPRSTGKILLGISDKLKGYNVHAACRAFKGMLSLVDGSVDNLNKVITANAVLYRNYTVKHINMICSILSDKRKIDYLSSNDYMRDIAWSYDNLTEFAPQLLEGFDWTRSVKEIHDMMVLLEKRRISPNLHVEIEYSDITITDIVSVNKSLGGQLRLKLAQDGNELIAWGNHLNHCIGAYANRALKLSKLESLILVGVFEPEKDMPTWCIEMRRMGNGLWAILQFRGLFNKPATSEMIDLVTKELNSVAKCEVSHSS